MKEAGKDYLDYVQDILDAAKDAEEFTKDLSLTEFKKDRKTVFAATRALEIIGEATKSPPKKKRLRTNTPRYPRKTWPG